MPVILHTISPQILQRYIQLVSSPVLKCAVTVGDQNLLFLCIGRNTLLPNIKLVLQEVSDKQSTLRAEGTFTM